MRFVCYYLAWYPIPSVPIRDQEIGTLNVGANLNTYCQVTTCIYQNMDYGGWAITCGYAPMLRITMNVAVVTSAGAAHIASHTCNSLSVRRLTTAPAAAGGRLALERALS
jgi:hypothetical protein